MRDHDTRLPPRWDRWRVRDFLLSVSGFLLFVAGCGVIAAVIFGIYYALRIAPVIFSP